MRQASRVALRWNASVWTAPMTVTPASPTQARKSGCSSYLPTSQSLFEVRSHDVDAPDVWWLHRRQFTALDQVIQESGR